MSRSRHRFGFGRVNLLKKVKVDGQWRFYPVVVEPGRRLNDRVRVKGEIETHAEGAYYLEWRERGRRRRQPVPNRSLVLEHARLKALELEAQNCGLEIGSTQSTSLVPPSNSALLAGLSRPDTVPSSSIPAAHLIWRGIESYLQEIVATAVRSQLATLGVMPQEAIPLGEAGKIIEATASKDRERRESVHPSQQPAPDGKVLIADAIESYLKDVEPPQREQKTYDEYRLVLSKFRETCSKRYLHEVNRDDCLSFMRHLYSLGNEARTVFNRVGIVLQLLKLHGIKGLLKKRDKPKFVVNVREMYQPEELEALFKACTADETVLYLFFLLTGERDKEVRHTVPLGNLDLCEKMGIMLLS